MKLGEQFDVLFVSDLDLQTIWSICAGCSSRKRALAEFEKVDERSVHEEYERHEGASVLRADCERSVSGVLAEQSMFYKVRATDSQHSANQLFFY